MSSFSTVATGTDWDMALSMTLSFLPRSASFSFSIGLSSFSSFLPLLKDEDNVGAFPLLPYPSSHSFIQVVVSVPSAVVYSLVVFSFAVSLL